MPVGARKSALLRVWNGRLNNEMLHVLQDCVRDEDGFMEKTPGMHCIPLPYSDDIRALKFPPKAKGVTVPAWISHLPGPS